MNELTKTELSRRLGELDERLKEQGIPLRFRPLECFKRLYGPVLDDNLRRRLFDPVTLWFIDRYGESAVWDRVLGRIPVLLRKELYLVQVPLVAEDSLVRLTDRIENLPKDVAEGFTPEEFKEVAPKVAAATEALQKLYTLHVDDHILDDIERGLIRRALFDFEHTATSLKQTGDTQNAVFHSHAAAEKFLKVAVKRAGGQQQLKSLGHNLDKIFGALVGVQKRFNWLASSVDALRKFAPSMEIRYSDIPRTVEDAVSAYNAALSICGTLAGIWLFDVARGARDSKFVPGRFYRDGAQRTYWCRELEDPDGAWLRLFTSTPPKGLLVADMLVSMLYSTLYLEVTDRDEIDFLQAKYDFHWRNRGQPVTPEEIGLKIVSGPEGSYVTAVRTIKIGSAPQG